MQIGQINFNNSGKQIYDICSREDVVNIVEVGTWNGMGSTMCILKALIDSKIDKNFISIELQTNMYNEALSNLKEMSDTTGIDYLSKVKIINGSLIDFKEVFWFDHTIVENCMKSGVDDVVNGISAAHESLYYAEDMRQLRDSANCFNQMPKTIDVLLLDGGGFTTYPEWCKLKERTKIVILDDTLTMKTKKIRQEILDSNEYLTIFDDLNERVGFSIFEKL